MWFTMCCQPRTKHAAERDTADATVSIQGRDDREDLLVEERRLAEEQRATAAAAMTLLLREKEDLEQLFVDEMNHAAWQLMHSNATAAQLTVEMGQLKLQAAEEKAALDRRLAEKTAAAAKLREEGNRIAGCALLLQGVAVERALAEEQLADRTAEAADLKEDRDRLTNRLNHEKAAADGRLAEKTAEANTLKECVRWLTRQLAEEKAAHRRLANKTAEAAQGKEERDRLTHQLAEEKAAHQRLVKETTEAAQQEAARKERERATGLQHQLPTTTVAPDRRLAEKAAEAAKPKEERDRLMAHRPAAGPWAFGAPSAAAVATTNGRTPTDAQSTAPTPAPTTKRVNQLERLLASTLDPGPRPETSPATGRGSAQVTPIPESTVPQRLKGGLEIYLTKAAEPVRAAPSFEPFETAPATGRTRRGLRKSRRF